MEENMCCHIYNFHFKQRYTIRKKVRALTAVLAYKPIPTRSRRKGILPSQLKKKHPSYHNSKQHPNQLTALLHYCAYAAN
jgi:hypothetical protein